MAEADGAEADGTEQDDGAANAASPHQLDAVSPSRRPVSVEPGDELAASAIAAPRPRIVTVLNGDSLSLIFKRENLSATDLGNMMSAGKQARPLTKLRPGQKLEFVTGADGSLQKLVHHADITRALQVTREGDAFHFEEILTPLEVVTATASGTLESSLYEAGQRAGITDRLIMGMVEIFGWDVDFALDIRAGDSFTVVYEELLKDGTKVREGEILAAEFVNRGRVIRAVRYEDPKGRVAYFSDDGLSMRKAFLRTPVKFARISSRFNLKRRHPILHKIRAHRGVDYAASRGTSIKATGDGKVIFAGTKRGYGKTVIIQHGAEYTTLYGHMHRIGKGIKRGRRVEQGQIIGGVGSTGLATGPHLHYEFRVRGIHKDPLKVKLPKALPIAKEYKGHFKSNTREVLAQLENASAKLKVASSQ
ncbi:MAG: OapA family protein [Gammaproteobacteria bacterium]